MAKKMGVGVMDREGVVEGISIGMLEQKAY